MDIKNYMTELFDLHIYLHKFTHHNKQRTPNNCRLKLEVQYPAKQYRIIIRKSIPVFIL